MSVQIARTRREKGRADAVGRAESRSELDLVGCPIEPATMAVASETWSRLWGVRELGGQASFKQGPGSRVQGPGFIKSDMLGPNP